MKSIELDDSMLRNLKPREAASHKGTYGKVAVIAGSKTMVGTAAFAALSAYRTGSGIVKIVTESGNEMALFTLVPEALVVTYEREMKAFSKVENELVDVIRWADAVLIGPGLGTDWYSNCLLKLVLENASSPIVIDADGLTLLKDQLRQLEMFKYPIVLTPHFGEMCRLTERSMDEMKQQSAEIARGFSRNNNVITVLKSHETVITAGETTYVNRFGNPGMATAGSGDVLAGIIASLLGQGYETEMCAIIGVLIHSMAGDLAKRKFGEYSLLARDIIDSISEILKGI